jgi:hypothetical protein
METVYLYLAFSYLFMFGLTFEFDGPWWLDVVFIALAPLIMPVFIGKFHGSMSFYKGGK